MKPKGNRDQLKYLKKKVKKGMVRKKVIFHEQKVSQFFFDLKIL